MSHREENYDPRVYDMDSNMYKVIYTPEFEKAFVTVFGERPDFSRFHMWLGPAGHYWMKPGSFKKYVTLVFTYNGLQFVYEQDDLQNPEGIIQRFAK